MEGKCPRFDAVTIAKKSIYKEEAQMKNDETMSELKPCPFCGGEAWMDSEPVGVGETEYHYVVCSECCNQSCSDACKELTIAAWNTRASDRPDPELAEVRAELIEFLDKVVDMPIDLPIHGEIIRDAWKLRAILDRKIGGA